MARRFDGSNDFIDFGNVFGFPEASDWSVLSFGRFDDLSDRLTLWAKYNNSASANRQLLFSVEATGLTSVYNFNGTGTEKRIEGASTLVADTWYLFALTNDAVADTLRLYVIDLTDGSFKEDAVTGTHDNDVSELTRVVYMGRREQVDDPWDGELAFGMIVNAKLTKEEITEYSFNPWRMAPVFITDHGATVFAPLGLASPEPDYSGNGNTGTVSGAVIGDNPPVGPMGFDLGWQGALAATGVNTQTLIATAVGVATLGRSIFKTLKATVTGVVSIVVDQITALTEVTIAATATGVATLGRTVFKTLAVASIGQPVLKLLVFLTLRVTAAGQASINTIKLVTRVLAATATGVVTLGRLVGKGLIATATGQATLSRAATFFRPLVATATGVATVGRTVFKTLVATALGVASATATLVVESLITIAAVATGVASLGVRYIQFFAPFTGGSGLGILDKTRTRWRRRQATWRKRL